MNKIKKYDLEERTLKYAKRIREFIKKLPKSFINFEDLTQLIKSSGSIGANYIEANDSLSKKDFYHRVKICRKEAKETKYWLMLINIKENNELEIERNFLIQESIELMNIFGSIVRKNIY